MMPERWNFMDKISFWMTVPDVYSLLSKKRLHITDRNLETEAIEKYFTHLTRKKGETLTKYIREEETA